MSLNRIFVSYSHQDSHFLTRLKVHLRPYERDRLVDVWSDERIQAGDDWRDEIESALESASVAILLVSADFLASDFIANNELPRLLDAARQRGTRIIPVILKPCAYTRIPQIARFQSVNNPSKSLIKQSEAEQEEIWDKVAEAIFESNKVDSVAPNSDRAEHPLTETKSIFEVDAEESIRELDAYFKEFVDLQMRLFSDELRNPKWVAITIRINTIL